jgi:dephospho-CoA kinase
MLRVGVTGGVASGKTTVARMMEARGAYVIQADIIAHDLMKPGEPAYDEVIKRFGQSIVNKNELGVIDRAKLGAIAFGEGRITELNEIIHPAVIKRQNEWMEEIGKKDPMSIAVVEAALILEAGVQGRFDKLVVVDCPVQERSRRFLERASKFGTSETDASVRFESIRSAQLPDADKLKAADFVIDNSGPMPQTESLVAALMEQLHALVMAK